MMGGSSSRLQSVAGLLLAITFAWVSGNVLAGSQRIADLAPLNPPVVVRIATDHSASDMGYYIADARGYLREVGIQAEFVNFPSSSEMLPMLAVDNVQVGGGITSTALFNAIDRGLDVRFLADQGHNIPGNPFYTMVVGKGVQQELKEIRDLKGRKVGLASIGSVNEYLLETALAAGNQKKSDIEMVVIDSYGNLTVALGNGAIDVAMHVEPFITLGTRLNLLDMFVDYSQILPEAQLSVMLGSQQFTERVEVSGRFMVAYLRGVRDAVDTFMQGKKDGEIYRILVQYTDLKDLELWREIAFPGLNPNGYFFKEDVRNQIRWYKRNGYYKGDINIDEVTDYSPVKFALEYLGSYDYPLEITEE